MNKKTNDKLNFYKKFIPYIFCFFIFSFLGWAMETIFCYGILGQHVKRGFLYSPICPIYGTGALILTLYLTKHTKNNYLKLFILFIIIFSYFEYFVGFALDALFASRWWDYSDTKYNLNGRITLFNSFIWGIITIIFAKCIFPLIEIFKKNILSKIPDLVQLYVSLILVFGICIDFVLSCIKYLK